MQNIHDLASYVGLLIRSIRLLIKRTGSSFVLAGLFLSFSRIMQTVAFFMPLKVLIVLSSDGSNKYSRYVEQWLNEEQFLAIIIAMVPISYGLYIVFGVIHRHFIDVDARRQIKVFKKMDCSKKKINKLKKLHLRLLLILSDTCIIILILLAVFVVYPLFSLILLSLVLFNLICFNAFVFEHDDTVRLTVFRLHPAQFVEYVTSVNYLFVFSILAIVVYHARMGVITALLALLLSRLCLQAVKRFSVQSRLVKKQLKFFFES